MFGLLRNLRGRGEGKEIPRPIETFGKAKIARALGEEILQASSDRKNAVQVIRDRLTAMTRIQKDELVDRLLARVALFVFDLPASPSNHHSDRFGLLDHLLDVAQRTAQALTGPGFQVSPEPSIHHREGPRWAYAGVIAAIAHGIGKPLDLEVVAPGSSMSWDPREEPLRLFCERHQLAGTPPPLWHFKMGRGDKPHERQIPTLLPLVLTPEVEGYLGPRLPSVLRALSPEENWNASPDMSLTAQEVIEVVHRIDPVTSIDDHPSRHPQVGMPAPVPGAAPPAAAPKPAPEEALPVPGPLPALRSIPPGFSAMRVPRPGKDRGDPVERARKIDFEVRPARFLKTLRRMLVRKRLARNGFYSQAYLTSEYIWLLVPEAFEVYARILEVPFDTQTVARMTKSLRAFPSAVPSPDARGTEFIKTRPDSPSWEALRLKTRAFLKESDLPSLGFHEFEIKVWGPAGRWEDPR